MNEFGVDKLDFCHCYIMSNISVQGQIQIRNRKLEKSLVSDFRDLDDIPISGGFLVINVLHNPRTSEGLYKYY